MLNDYTEYIKKKIPNCHFPSNPCRIQFGSRQIVVFREDLLQKMSRNAIKIPDPDKLSDQNKTNQNKPKQIKKKKLLKLSRSFNFCLLYLFLLIFNFIYISICCNEQ